MHSCSKWTHSRGTSSYRAAEPDWDAPTTRTEGYTSEFSCSTVGHRFSKINFKITSYLDSYAVNVFLSSFISYYVSKLCFTSLLSPRNESSVCLKISRFTPLQTDGECIDITFSHTSQMAFFSKCKIHIVFKAMGIR